MLASFITDAQHTIPQIAPKHQGNCQHVDIMYEIAVGAFAPLADEQD